MLHKESFALERAPLASRKFTGQKIAERLQGQLARAASFPSARMSQKTCLNSFHMELWFHHNAMPPDTLRKAALRLKIFAGAQKMKAVRKIKSLSQPHCRKTAMVHFGSLLQQAHTLTLGKLCAVKG